ncbi:MAG: TonB-dependent receptor [Campylobacterota bacterium]|nr:TonB-dependent receptor [Campylobacterota bacterium]
MKKIYTIYTILMLASISNAQMLDPITVTATQNPELKADESVLPVDIITRDIIEQKGITSLHELFSHTSGVDVITAGPGSVMPIIRGLSHEQVLILVDGVRLSDERPGGNHVLSIDPAQIERVEIVKGPGSVLYGAGAVGGVVNFITKKAPKGKTEEFKISGDAGVGYETNNNAKKQTVQINASSSDLNFYVGAINKKSDNIETPDEELKFSYYDGYTVWGGGDYSNGDWNTEVNLWQTKADIGIAAPRTFVKDYYKDETHTMINGKISYKNSGAFIERFDLQLAWQEHNRHRIRKADTTKLVDIKVDKETKTLRGQFILLPTNEHRITTGVDMFDEKLTSTRIMDGFPPAVGKFDGVPVMAPSSRTAIGLFAQDEIVINNKLNITLGARVDSVTAKSDGAKSPYFLTSSHSDTDTAISGSIGGIYKLNEDAKIYANLGRAFRAPTIIERYYSGPHDGPAQDQGNPDLDPEKSINFDIGMRFKGQNYRTSVGVFYNKVDNMIKKILTNPSAPVSAQVYTYQNISEAELYGGEFDGIYYISDEFSTFGNITLTRGNDKTTDHPLTAIPPLKARYGINYEREINNYYLLLKLSGESAMRQDSVGKGEKETPGYTIANFRLLLSHDNGLSTSLSLENMFDRVTYDHLSYAWQSLDYASIGRNLKLDINYKF